jgi:hypothetical protein
MTATYQRPLARTCIGCGAILPPYRRGYYCETHGRESPRSVEVEVTVTRGAENWLLVFACPWCPPKRGQPRVHVHGGGPLNEPPLLGHRVSHCYAEGAPSGYELVEAPLPYGCPGCHVVTDRGIDRCSGCTP